MTAEKRKKSLPKTVWYAAGGVLLLMAVLWLTAAFLFFEPLPPHAPAVVTAEDLVFHSRLAGRVMQQIWRGKPKQDDLLLDQARVDSTLRLLDNAWELGQLEGQWRGVTAPRYWAVGLLPEGKISVTFPYDTGMRFLRGGVVILRGQGTLEKGRDGEWKIQVEEAKLGRIPLPASWLTWKISQQIARLRREGKLKKLDAAVVCFQVDKTGNAVVTYRPAGFMQILMH